MNRQWYAPQKISYKRKCIYSLHLGFLSVNMRDFIEKTPNMITIGVKVFDDSTM